MQAFPLCKAFLAYSSLSPGRNEIKPGWPSSCPKPKGPRQQTLFDERGFPRLIPRRLPIATKRKLQAGLAPLNDAARSNLRGRRKTKGTHGYDHIRLGAVIVTTWNPATRAVRLTHCDPRLFPLPCLFSIV
jgi:hypothetical protein